MALVRTDELVLRRTAWLMLVTDVGFLVYWTLIATKALPPNQMYASYDVPAVAAWNWSFLPLDVLAFDHRLPRCAGAAPRANLRASTTADLAHAHVDRRRDGAGVLGNHRGLRTVVVAAQRLPAALPDPAARPACLDAANPQRRARRSTAPRSTDQEVQHLARLKAPSTRR